jgi:hypothetical protein
MFAAQEHSTRQAASILEDLICCMFVVCFCWPLSFLHHRIHVDITPGLLLKELGYRNYSSLVWPVYLRAGNMGDNNNIFNCHMTPARYAVNTDSVFSQS